MKKSERIERNQLIFNLHNKGISYRKISNQVGLSKSGVARVISSSGLITNIMTEQERQKYIDVGLRILNIQLHPELLTKVIKVIDLVDKKKGDVNIEDIIKIDKKWIN